MSYSESDIQVPPVYPFVKSLSQARRQGELLQIRNRPLLPYSRQRRQTCPQTHLHVLHLVIKEIGHRDQFLQELKGRSSPGVLAQKSG